MSKTINLGFCKLCCHDDYVVSEINEGVDMTKEQHVHILEALTECYKDRPFGYISNRKYSFSLNPIHLTEYVNLAENLIVYGVVANNPAQRLSYAIEKIFFSKPLHYFTSYDNAVKWAKESVQKYKDSDLKAQKSA
ncbi:hypothetical protein [Robertkochia solimangrovi]|uniref:hypothetical protein n=1 Tax=Robertkochia solimangrovi TaxID=2213046 RepID=UPI00117DC340|nr:hypothetical protein [Robertkochia solimangrovi]TRZ42911.1 hypothetical protein DMZ48_12665 [Robertkochia solimangrovi]